MVRKLVDYLKDQATRDADDRNLVSRSEERREKQRLESIRFDLATKLTSLKKSQLARLELPDPCLDIIDELRIIESAPARTRALKRLRAELRDIDHDALTRAIGELDGPRPSEPPTAAAAWLQRLGTTGDTALDQFVEAFPQCDRARLRTLIRNFTRAKPNEQPRAQVKLLSAIREAMGAAGRAIVIEPTIPKD